VMSPKSLLRHKAAVSSLDDLVNGEFQTIIGEQDDTIQPENITRLVLCSGKVYYDLIEARTENNPDDVAIIRIEQLYPFPVQDFKDQLALYPNLTTLVWCQEEPKNQGAWYQSRHNFIAPDREEIELVYCGRPASASPAVGNLAKHLEQQHAVINAALYGHSQ